MLFGHNTNVSVGDSLFHVQTEDRGEAQALIDTAVYFRGQVLHRRTSNYSDLLPLDAQKEVILKQRVDDQHHSVEKDLRSGALALPAETRSAAPQMPELRVELLNAKNWLNGKRASLQVIVQDRTGKPAANASISARMEGAAEPVQASSLSDVEGRALLEFDIPQVAGVEAALVVEAERESAKGQLRCQLKARPKVPAV